MDEELEQNEDTTEETTEQETPVAEDSQIKTDIIAELGANYNTSDSNVLDVIIADITIIAKTISNKAEIDDTIYPYIKKAVKSEYLSRGAEGLSSRSEGSISANYKDITETLRNDIVRGGLRRCY